MKKYINNFLNYTNDYLEYGIWMERKINHTFRVMSFCEEIAKSLNLKDEDIKLAKICGLVHDIGRFEQYKKYTTFQDSISIDHGDLGADILRQDEFLREFNDNPSLDDLIIKTVINHNKYKISNDLSEREKLFCNIVRDADKLDILYLYAIGEFIVDTENMEFSDLIYNNLINGKLIKREEKSTKGDILSVSLGFVFDLNFKKSYEILKEKDFINKEIEIHYNRYNNPKFRQQLVKIRKKINECIDNNCK